MLLKNLYFILQVLSLVGFLRRTFNQECANEGNAPKRCVMIHYLWWLYWWKWTSKVSFQWCKLSQHILKYLLEATMVYNTANDANACNDPTPHPPSVVPSLHLIPSVCSTPCSHILCCLFFPCLFVGTWVQIRVPHMQGQGSILFKFFFLYYEALYKSM